MKSPLETAINQRSYRLAQAGFETIRAELRAFVAAERESGRPVAEIIAAVATYQLK